MQSSILLMRTMEMTSQLARYCGELWLPANACRASMIELTIFSPRLTAMLRPGKAMMSILLNIERARSTVGTSSNETVTAPRHGIVSTKGFSVIRAQAFSCRCHKTQHKSHVPSLQSAPVANGCTTCISVLHNCYQASKLLSSCVKCAGLHKFVVVKTKLAERTHQHGQSS